MIQFFIYTHTHTYIGFPGSTMVKNLPVNARNTRNAGSASGSERSPGEGNGNPLQYPGLENSMDYIVHWVAKSQTRLNDFRFPNM